MQFIAYIKILLTTIYKYVIRFASLDVLYTYDILHNYNCFSDLCHVYRQYYSTMNLGFEIMPCRWVGAKSLSEQLLGNCELNP